LQHDGDGDGQRHRPPLLAPGPAPPGRNHGAQHASRAKLTGQPHQLSRKGIGHLGPVGVALRVPLSPAAGHRAVPAALLIPALRLVPVCGVAWRPLAPRSCLRHLPILAAALSFRAHRGDPTGSASGGLGGRPPHPPPATAPTTAPATGQRIRDTGRGCWHAGFDVGGSVQQILALSRCAVIVRHWFEIDLDDASMEHGARIELRELVPQPRRGSESAAQLITADRPLWRADLFDRLTDAPGSYRVGHLHPAGAASGHACPVDPADASELSGLADAVVTLARQVAPERCGSAADCYGLTRDARGSVQLMIKYLRRPDLLDEDWVSPWRQAA